MAKHTIPIKIEHWTRLGIVDARNDDLSYPKDKPKEWVRQENRLAYKEAYDRECALLLITRGEK